MEESPENSKESLHYARTNGTEKNTTAFSVLSFGCFPGVWFILTDVSEHSICSIFKADDLEVRNHLP
jgi:hypothetical protein